MPGPICWTSVGFVVVLLAGGCLFQQAHEAGKSGDGGKPTRAREFAIEGMQCQGCVDTVTAALTKIPGVRSAQVSLQEKRAVVVADESQVPTEKILSAITTAGYQGKLSTVKP